jgi:hypothetical protein
MLFLKLIAPFAAFVVVILQFLLEHRWKDRRTKQFKKSRLLLFWFIVISAVVSGAIIYFDDENSKELGSNLAEIKEKNDSLKTLVIQIEQGAHHERLTLQEEIRKLHSSLDPFRAIATQRFADLSESEALSQLANDVQQLGIRFDQELTSIKTLDAEINIKIEANWINDKPPNFPALLQIGTGPDTWLDIRNKTGKVERLELYGGTTPKVVASDKEAVVSYRREAAAGSWIIGTDKTDLVGCDGLNVWLYSINSNMVKDKKVMVISIEVILFVNGEYYCKLMLQPRKTIEITNDKGSSPIMWRGSSKFSFTRPKQTP